MNKKHLREYWEKIWAKVKAEQLEEAQELAKEAYSLFPNDLKRTSFLLAMTQSLSNQKEAAITTLNKAIEQKVFWSPWMLDFLAQKQFANIKGEEGFRTIYEKCAEWFAEVQANSTPSCITQIPKNIDINGSLPLMINLHWRGGGGSKMVEQQWGGMLDFGYAMLIPQSSQLLAEHQYCWDDYGLSVKEIIQHYKTFTKEYKVQKESIILAGASQGGATALKMLLEDALPVAIHRFILLYPFLQEISEYEVLLPKAKEKGVKGVIIMGDKDKDYELVKSFFDSAIKKGLNWKWINMEGVGHSFPANFEEYLQEGMDFLC